MTGIPNDMLIALYWLIYHGRDHWFLAIICYASRMIEEIGDNASPNERYGAGFPRISKTENKPSRRTVIFTFDSLRSPRTQTHKILREYLRAEARDKQGISDSNVPYSQDVQVCTEITLRRIYPCNSTVTAGTNSKEY